MIAMRTAAALAVALLVGCSHAPPEGRSGLTVIPVPPPMPATPIPPGGRPASLQTAHAGACALAVFREVPARVPGVMQVQTDGASYTEYPAEGDLVQVGGAGRFYRGGDDWQQFTFRCVYDTASASIAVFDVTIL